jgi:hypothetical protein
MTAGGRRSGQLLVIAALTLTALIACRRRDADAGRGVATPIASAPPTRYIVSDAAVSDGILAGLQRELETAQKVNPADAERVKALRPMVDCVEAVSATEWRAHFGYANSSSGDVSVSASLFNRFWPPPLARQQPEVFAPGSRSNVVQVTFNPLSSTAWILGSGYAVADSHSIRCKQR